MTRLAELLPVITDNIRRIYAQFLCGYLSVPTISESFPWTDHFLDLKLPEISLKQLLFIITKLHMKIAVKTTFGVFLSCLQHRKTLQKYEKSVMKEGSIIKEYTTSFQFPSIKTHLKNVLRWLFENPSLSIII